MIQIPSSLLPADGRFGSGPAKIRPEAVDHLAHHSHLLGTSHRQAPVRELVADVQTRLAELYQIPEDYEVVLGNGGSSLVWDLATVSLVENQAAHGVFGEFSRKFYTATNGAPFLEPSVLVEAEPGSVALPEAGQADAYCWAHNETSTGAAAPVHRIGDGLVLVDATSAAGGIEADIAATDLYYFALQKNFSSDGGLWVAFASPAAIDRAARIKETGRWIPAMLDFSTALSNSRQHQTLNTPALATLLLAQAQLLWFESLGGLSAAAERCRTSTDLLYRWAEERSFAAPFVAEPAHRSPVVATIDLDQTVSASQVIAVLRDNGIVDVDPYRALNRNQLRIGCYAAVDPSDVEALIACLDWVIERL